MPPSTPTKRARALFGMSFMFVLLAFTRWGSYIGHNPIYISDVLIVCAIIHWVLSGAQSERRPLDPVTRRPPPTIALSMFVGYVVLRALFSATSEPILEIARDAVPYLYGFVAFFSSRSYVRSSEADRAKTQRIVWIALIAHLAWLTPLVLLHHVAGLATLPGMDAPVFQVRPDIDSAISGVAGGLLLRRLLLGQGSRAWAIVGLVIATVDVLALYTRAGLVAYAAALIVAAFVTYSAMPKRDARRTALILSVPAIVLIAAFILPQTTPGQRLLATLRPTQAATVQQESAVGTTRARETVWSGVISWVGQDNSRIVFGSGFGNDFLTQSGTIQYLEGTEYTGVRSPHDWFVGTYARVGLIGLALAVIVCLGLFRLIYVNRRHVGGDELQCLSALLIISILIVASLGVVLESPFGAIPFFWAAGVIYASRHQGLENPNLRPSTDRSEKTSSAVALTG